MRHREKSRLKLLPEISRLRGRVVTLERQQGIRAGRDYADSLIDTIPAALAITDIQGRIERVNCEFIKKYGLGLCMAHRIVCDAHGHVRAESDLGRGATFLITLSIQGD